MTRYIVWVNGVAVYESDELASARKMFNKWLAKGCEDVALEEVQP